MTRAAAFAAIVAGAAFAFGAATKHRTPDVFVTTPSPVITITVPPAPVEKDASVPPPPPPPNVVVVDVDAGSSGDAACQQQATDLRCIGMREGTVLLRCSDVVQETGRAFAVDRKGVTIETDLRASSIQFTDNTSIASLAICERVGKNEAEW